MNLPEESYVIAKNIYSERLDIITFARSLKNRNPAQTLLQLFHMDLDNWWFKDPNLLVIRQAGGVVPTMIYQDLPHTQQQHSLPSHQRWSHPQFDR